jgi:hypothetical protein
MKLRTVLVVALLIITDSIIVRAQQPAKASIEGVIVHATTGEPIPGAQVTITAGTGPARPSLAELFRTAIANGGPPTLGARGRGAANPLATTLTDGKFSFELDPGSYRIAVSANNYVPAEYGQRSLLGSGKVLYLNSGETAKDLTIRVVPTGALKGRIADETGAPAEQVPVQILRVVYNAFGQKLMDIGATAVTDDRGEFRLYGIVPGPYYLNAGGMAGTALPNAAAAAMLTGVEAVRIAPSPARTRFYTNSYYPGVSELERARLIDVHAGAESVANMQVRRATRYRVRGRVIDSRTGGPPARGSVSLTYNTLTGGTNSRLINVNPQTGDFEFRDVVPAAYTLEAQTQDAPVQTANSPAEQVASAFARQTVRVPITVEGDVENVVLTVTVPTTVEGRFILAGEPLSALPGLDRIRPGLRQFDNGGVLSVGPSAPLSGDGKFNLGSVRDGDYKFGISGLPPGFYVEKAEIDGVDLLNEPIAFSGSSSRTLEIVSRRGAGTISGKVSDEQAHAIAGVQVVLVPDQKRRMDLYATTVTDRSGGFRFEAIPPGNYRVFSWEGIEPFAYFDPAVTSRYEMRSPAVRVSDNSVTTIEIRIISAEN